MCLTTPNERALRLVADKLADAGVRFVSIVETEAPHAGELMAIGCAPAGREVLRRLLSSLPLLR